MSGQQTHDASNFTDASIYASINGAAFVDICGEASSIAVSGGDRDSAEFFTACGDTPIVLVGKRKKLQVALKVAYTEGNADTYAIVKQAYENKRMIFQLRWIPRGNATGNLRYTTDATYSFVTSNPYPGGEVASAALTEFTVNVETSAITQDVVP
jgi:hypothetical protein